MQSVLSFILRPVAWIYGLITSMRNQAYEKGWLKSFEFTLPVIVVGNLKVGGTGKTPMVEYITRALKSRGHNVGIISRGYKRKTKGFILADVDATAKTIGDEPYQYYRKWGDEVAVAVCEDRAFAIPHLLYEKPETNVLVLDDAFQHQRVKPQWSVMLTEFSRPFYHDFILPAGLLRESRKYTKRADAVVVTKCPSNVSKSVQFDIKKAVQQYSPGCPVYFTTVNYSNLVGLFNDAVASSDIKKYVVITGIANARPMIDYLKTKGEVVEHLEYPDHYDYTTKDIAKITTLLKSNEGSVLVTTEKDAVKLRSYERHFDNLDCYYLPIVVEFLEGENEFLDQLEKSIVLSD